MSDIIEGEAVEETGMVVHAGGTLIRGGDSPGEFIGRAAEIATALAQVVRQQGLVTNIQGRDHPRVEAWTLLGSMLGVFPVVEWTRKTDDGWEARVEARTLAGHTVGAAEAMCNRSERTWAKRDDYALRSMAQTRATSKAMRGPLGFVMTLAGLETTPSEEMDEHSPAGGTREIDTAKDLLPGAPSGSKFVQEGMALLKAVDKTVNWPVMVTQALRGHFGVEKASDVPDERYPEFGRRYANMCVKVKELSSSSFPPITDDEIRQAFAWAFAGVAVDIVRIEKQADNLPDF